MTGASGAADRNSGTVETVRPTGWRWTTLSDPGYEEVPAVMIKRIALTLISLVLVAAGELAWEYRWRTLEPVPAIWSLC